MGQERESLGGLVRRWRRPLISAACVRPIPILLRFEMPRTCKLFLNRGPFSRSSFYSRYSVCVFVCEHRSNIPLLCFRTRMYSPPGPSMASSLAPDALFQSRYTLSPLEVQRVGLLFDRLEICCNVFVPLPPIKYAEFPLSIAATNASARPRCGTWSLIHPLLYLFRQDHASRDCSRRCFF